MKDHIEEALQLAIGVLMMVFIIFMLTIVLAGCSMMGNSHDKQLMIDCKECDVSLNYSLDLYQKKLRIAK